MEKQQFKVMPDFVHTGTKIFLFLFCWLLGFTAYAQTTSSVITKSDDPVQGYLEKHKDTPLVRMYRQLPGDQGLNQTLRYAVIMDSPIQFPEFNQVDLDRIAEELRSQMETINYIEQEVQKGVSYEMAKMTYERKMKLTESQQPTREQNQNSAPSLSIPK